MKKVPLQKHTTKYIAVRSQYVAVNSKKLKSLITSIDMTITQYILRNFAIQNSLRLPEDEEY